MSYIRRTAAVATAAFILFVAFPALAKTPTHHHHARALMQAGYSAPVTRLIYQPANDFSKDCDLPSSGCSDGMRISN
jgi:hypothetical protein